MASIVVAGDTSGTVTLAAPLVAGTTTLTLPTTDGTVVVTGTTPTLNGITFPATQVPSADANTLDDYEEGTWTPVVAGSSTAGTGTYILQEGVYTKIGNMVISSCYVVWTAHTGTGDLTIAGLPFAANGSLSVQAGSVFASEFNAGTNATQVCAFPSAGTTAIIFRGFINNAQRTVPAMDTLASIGVTLTYRI
jgi:hypothetical protein